MPADHREFWLYCRHPNPCPGSPWTAKHHRAALQAARAHADTTGHPTDAVLIERTTLARAQRRPTRREAPRD